jgi:RNA polymerase sigma factor (sigma-70 family)
MNKEANMDDAKLLQEFVECRSETAFAELVARHINLVYSTALRMVRDTALAKDVAQLVFIQLARKAPLIRSGQALPGWLYRVTRCQAANALRDDHTRRQRETEAMNMTQTDAGSSMAWESIAPHLEAAMNTLSTADQNAVVLRFFQGRSWREVAGALSLREDAAQKRVSRAVDKLRSYFVRRGIGISTTMIVSVIAANAVSAAPTGLASTITTTSLAGAGSFTLLSTIIKNILMKKTACAVLVVALAASITVPIIIAKAEPTPAGPPPFKYGLYLHFGISTFAGYQGAKDIGHVAPERYAPTGLDVAGWVRTAKQAGMDCAVLTVKHEAGFCLWDADDYDYDVASSPVKTDVVAEFISACKAEGIIPGIHYSIPDAHNEGAVRFNGSVGAKYFELIKKQTKELHTKYPDIKVQVFDIAFRLSKSQLLELRQTVKALNPSCAVLCEMGKASESKYVCDTVNQGWFWSPNAQTTPTQKLYAEYSDARARKFPFLLNVGPDKSGHIPDQDTATLMKLKRLIEQNPPQ